MADGSQGYRGFPGFPRELLNTKLGKRRQDASAAGDQLVGHIARSSLTSSSSGNRRPLFGCLEQRAVVPEGDQKAQLLEAQTRKHSR